MVRSANVNDAESIAFIHVLAWQHAYINIFPTEFLANLSVEARTAAWQQLLVENQNTTIVKELDGGIVGWASGGVSRDADAIDELEVHAIYVLPDYWGRGIGTELMYGMDTIFSPHLKQTLWVLRENRRAIRFYQKLGYEPDGMHNELERGGVKQQEIRLRKFGLRAEARS